MGRDETPRFEFATAGRIIFGPGTAAEAGRSATALGRRALVVTGRNADRAALLLRSLAASGVATVAFPTSGEPTVAHVQEGIHSAVEEGVDLVIGFGGGSALDTAKAIAAAAMDPGDIFDHLEVVGRGEPLHHPALPCIAIPTTAGTGAEVTRNSVLASPAHRVKVSLRGPLLLPRLAIVDPELTISLPTDLTAATGLDALTQLVEPFVSQRANPVSDAICREGLRRSVRSLRRACQDGTDLAARTDLALASLCGGLALTNAGLGAVHGLAAPLGGATSTPHGAACARLLAPVMEANVRALRERAPGSPALRRYQELAVILTGDPLALIEDGIACVEALVRDTGLLSLAALGLTASEIPAIVEKAAATNSMKANPVALTTEELWDVLKKAFQENPRRP